MVREKTYHFSYQKNRISSRSVSVHLYLKYNASRTHRRGRGDQQQYLTFFGGHHEAYSTLRTVCMYLKVCW